MKKIGLVIFLLSIIYPGCAPKTSGTKSKTDIEIENLTLKMAEKNTLSGKYVGRGGDSSPQYQLFEELLKKANEQQLTKLSDHANPVVRTYAFWGLAKKNAGNVQKVLEKHIQDNATMVTAFGDIADEITVSEFMLELVSGDDIDPDCMKLKSDEINRLKNLMKK